MPITKDDLTYDERVTSNWTLMLFLGLTILFLMLFVWRVGAGGPGVLAVVFFIFFCFFLFYSVNYRTLRIHLNRQALKLKFGIFTWTVPLDNVAGCQLDELPVLMKYGGAGIHFMTVRKRYRASFNFLEHPRVVIELERKAGPVQDISFSTRQPEKILALIQRAVSARKGTRVAGEPEMLHTSSLGEG
jgi:hypothetical protein